MLVSGIIRRQWNLIATLCARHRPSGRWSNSSLHSFFSTDSRENPCSELARVPNLSEGCDYQHWLVVMGAPEGYPLRDEIVNGYVKTLAMALGSEDEAKRSMYSVSTKYYHAFGCKVTENLACKIKSLPNVKWVLPDSYLSNGESSYGGEPFVNGEVVPYDEKYHVDWVRDQNDDKDKSVLCAKKPRRKRKKNQSS